jgi:uncharacterized coiled-coil protein SlyX
MTFRISTHFLAVALAGAAGSLVSCGQEASAPDLSQQLAEQNQKLEDHEKMLLEQDQKITQLSWQLEMLQQTLDRQMQAANTQTTDNALLGVDFDENARHETLRELVGFNGRLSAGLAFAVYSKELGDLDASLAQQLLEIKNQNFVDQAKVIQKQYDLAGELWDKLSSADTDSIALTPLERYNYSLYGINFADGYRARLSDIPRFWRAANDQTQRLIEMEQSDAEQQANAKN